MNAHSFNIAALAVMIDRKRLVDVLKVAKLIVERRNTIPILSHVLFDVRDGVGTITATDLDMESVTEFPCAVEGGAGRFTVECKSLADAVGKFKGDAVRIVELGSHKVELQCLTTGAAVTLASLPAADWPRLQMPSEAPVRFAIGERALGDVLAATKQAISHEETRYYLNGVFMHAAQSGARHPRTVEHELAADALASAKSAYSEARRTLDSFDPELEHLSEAIKAATAALVPFETAYNAPDCLRFAATDGHRLVRYTVALPDGLETLPDCIIPKKMTGVAQKLIGTKASDDRAVRIDVYGTKVAMTLGYTRLVTKLIDGTFPDYSRVIPSQNDVALSVDAAQLSAALGTVTASCSEKTRAAALSVTAGQPLVISASSPENGRSATAIDAHVPTGELAIGFNAKYLADAMSLFDGNVTLNLADSAAPARIESASRPELTIVVMPMRVGATIMTVDDVAKLNMNPIERFQADVPQLAREAVETVDQMLAGADFTNADKAARHGIVVASRKLRKRRLAALGAAMTSAIDYLASRGKTRCEARLIVKALAAVETGDHATYQRSLAYSRALAGEPSRAIAVTPAVQGAAVESVAIVTPEPVALETVEPEPVEEAIAYAAAVEEGAAVDVPEPANDVEPEPAVVDEPAPAAIDEPSDEAGAIDVVKIETVYGQIMFVDGADYRDEARPFCRRVTKLGVPMCDSEAQGGAWKRVLRDNIKRVVLPRASADKPLASRKPVDQPSGERLAAVEAQLAALSELVATLQARPAVTTPVEPVAMPEARPARTEAHLRTIRAYLALRRERAAMRAALGTAWARAEALEFDKVELEHRVANMASAYSTRHGKLRTRAYAIRLRGERAKLRADLEGARSTIASLAVQCTALEQLGINSGNLDKRRVEHEQDRRAALILPVVTSRPRVFG